MLYQTVEYQIFNHAFVFSLRSAGKEIPGHGSPVHEAGGDLREGPARGKGFPGLGPSMGGGGTAD